jgi:hypothetical protein
MKKIIEAGIDQQRKISRSRWDYKMRLKIPHTCYQVCERLGLLITYKHTRIKNIAENLDSYRGKHAERQWGQTCYVPY